MQFSKLGTKFLVASGLFISSLTAAAAQEACTSYTVQAGDTLSTIAEAAYGTYNYQNIFNANRELIGDNANDLEDGLLLVLPCLDGRLTAESEFEEIIEQQEAIADTQTVSNAYAPPIRLVTGTDWAPFTDEDMIGQGMFVRLANTALHRAGNNREFRIDFINDWNSHLDTLLPAGLYDFSIAWTFPDCNRVDTMSEFAQTRCAEFNATVPVYEVVYGYYTLPDNKYAGVTRLEDLEGARVCRMDAWPTWDLEEAGLIEPVIEMIRPANPVDCIEAVLNGEADITGMETESAEGGIDELNAAAQIVQNPRLNYILSMHFISHKTNPHSKLFTTMMNNGLNEMRETGEWYDVVSSSLAEFNGLLPIN